MIDEPETPSCPAVVAHPLPGDAVGGAVAGEGAAGGFERASAEAGADPGADVADVAAGEPADDLVDVLVDGLAAGDVAARSLEVVRAADGAERCGLATGVLGVQAASVATATMAGIMRAVDRNGMDISGAPQ
ncbi:MAG TPA: hypothetical protein VGG75_18910 [Trebonia sp.]